MPAGARGLEIAEDAIQQPPLEQPIGLGRKLISLVALFQALAFGQVAEILLDLPGELVEFFDVARLGEFGERLQVDHADLGVFRGLFELLQQPIDLFQFLA